MIKIRQHTNTLRYLHFFLILGFVLFWALFQLPVLSQSQHTDFIINADKVNLIIAKALLKEKGYDISELKDGLTYAEFSMKIIPIENKDLAKQIDEIKNKILTEAEPIELVPNLEKFFNNAISKIPNQKNPLRKKTIDNLFTEFNTIKQDLSKRSEKENIVENKIAIPPEISSKNSEEGFDFTLWGGFLALILIYIFTVIKLLNLIKDYKHVKNRYNKFESEQRELNNKYSERVPLHSPQKRNDLFHIPESEIEKIKNFILIEVSRQIREIGFLNQISAEIQPEVPEIVSSQELKMDKCIVKYSESPEKDGYFDKRFLKASDDLKSLYKIVFYPDSNKYEFDILINKVIIHRNAMNHLNNMLKPACDFFKEPSPDDKQIFKIGINLGTLEEDNDKLMIIDKLKIKFG